ncbi:hypothetical protein KJ991_02250 [Patescibacteria group bacterium]|nr:hypothetical protein [Patescibacteria group bacterium]MBU4115609.1 hypothetical protein [Patescibacteria group bacterium]
MSIISLATFSGTPVPSRQGGSYGARSDDVKIYFVVYFLVSIISFATFSGTPVPSRQSGSYGARSGNFRIS